MKKNIRNKNLSKINHLKSRANKTMILCPSHSITGSGPIFGVMTEFFSYFRGKCFYDVLTWSQDSGLIDVMILRYEVSSNIFYFKCLICFLSLNVKRILNFFCNKNKLESI